MNKSFVLPWPYTVGEVQEVMSSQMAVEEGHKARTLVLSVTGMKQNSKVTPPGRVLSFAAGAVCHAFLGKSGLHFYVASVVNTDTF